MKVKMLVVDDNKPIIDLIKEYFENSSQIEVVDSACDGEEALEKIEKSVDNIDLILLDLIMPKKDGIYVLAKLKEKDINKDIIVVTSYNEPETIRRVSEYGVKYFILKPFDLADLENKILDIAKNKHKKKSVINIYENSMQVSITKVLHSLGIPSHIKGYQYIREAIYLVYENPGLIGGITKELYPAIGQKFDTSVSRVERAIRHAIEVSWNRGDWDLMNEIFGHSVDIDRAKPTNSEFIVTIADKLRLDTLKVR